MLENAKMYQIKANMENLFLNVFVTKKDVKKPQVKTIDKSKWLFEYDNNWVVVCVFTCQHYY
jgi:hypothetical protein